jgi:hypothetical protein
MIEFNNEKYLIKGEPVSFWKADEESL